MASKKRTAKQKEFDLLLKHADNIDEFTKRVKTTDVEIIRKYRDKLNWWNIVTRKTLTNEFIEEFWEDMESHIEKVRVNPYMNMEFLKTNRNYIDWRYFVYDSSGSRFTVDFIEGFKEELRPYFRIMISKTYLPKESRDYLLNEEQNNQDMYMQMSKSYIIKPDAIEKYKDFLDWDLLSKNARCLLNDKYFKMYQDRINLYEYTSLNIRYGDSYEAFLKRVKKVVNEDFLLKYKIANLNWHDIIHCNSHRLNRDIKDGNVTLPLDFFKKYKDQLPYDVQVSYKRFIENYKFEQSKTYPYFYGIPWEF